MNEIPRKMPEEKKEEKKKKKNRGRSGSLSCSIASNPENQIVSGDRTHDA